MTLTKEQIKDYFNEWGILLEEEMNIALDTNWGQKFKWETAVAFACMLDDVERVEKVIQLYDALVDINLDFVVFAITHKAKDLPLISFDREELIEMREMIDKELARDRGY